MHIVSSDNKFWLDIKHPSTSILKNSGLKPEPCNIMPVLIQPGNEIDIEPFPWLFLLFSKAQMPPKGK